MKARTALPLWIIASLAGSGCATDAADETPDCTGEDCDQGGGTLDSEPLRLCKSPADFETRDGKLACTPCGDKLVDASGRGFLPRFIAGDPLLAHVYMRFEDRNTNDKIDPDEIDCPLTMPEIMAKLDKFDNANCTTDLPVDDRGIETRIVSETAALLGRDNAGYRAVTSRRCNGRQKHELLFSTFGYSGAAGASGTGLHITEDGSPGQVEIIAFDQSEAVFNYYKEVGNRMRFFGSSTDFVVAGPGGPNLTSTRGCANCHPGGGLNMKELQAPWTHWSNNDNIDGADVLVQSRTAFLGALNSGADMQFGVTEPGNTAWNRTKVAFLRSLTSEQLTAARQALADDKLSAAQRADLERRQLGRPLHPTQLLLQPLFCTVQVNINGQGGGFIVPDRLIGSNLRDVFLPFFGGLPANAYPTAFAAIGGEVPGTGMPDVGLLEFVPDLAPEERTLEQIRGGMIAKLTAANPGAESPAAQLLESLSSLQAGRSLDSSAAQARYTDACTRRPPVELLRDGLKLRSLQRKLVYRFDESGSGLDVASGVDQHPFAVFEFEQSMPADRVTPRTDADPDSDDAVHPDARFSPIDCTLVSRFTPIETVP